MPASPTPLAAPCTMSARAQQDWALIQAAVGGREKAYADLMRLYQKSLYHVVLKIVYDAEEAQDLTMETFGKAFRNLSRYSPQYAFSTWLFRIATNNCIDFIRRKKLKTLSLNASLAGSEGPDLFLDVRAPGPDPQEAYVRQQRQELVQQAVAQLPAKYLRLVQLRYFQELSYEEISAELQLPLGTVKAQLFRARELLLNLLKPQESAL